MGEEMNDGQSLVCPECVRLQEENTELRKQADAINIRETIAHALVLAYRDARREGVPPSQSFFVMGILRELDAVYERTSWDPPPETPANGA